MAISLSPEMVALLGIFFGLLARSLLPYLRKVLKEGQDLKWENKYLALLIIAAIATILTFPGFTALSQMQTSEFSILFTNAFIYGFFVDAAMIEGFEWIRPGKTQAPESTTTPQ